MEVRDLLHLSHEEKLRYIDQQIRNLEWERNTELASQTTNSEKNLEKEMSELKTQLIALKREDKKSEINAELIGELLDEQKNSGLKLEREMKEIRGKVIKNGELFEDLLDEQRNVQMKVDKLLKSKVDKTEQMDFHEIRMLENNQIKNDLRIKRLEENYYHPESMNGNMIWIIDNFVNERREAVMDATRSNHSPVFLTSNFGYKMGLRIYLNGDQSHGAQNRFISLYIMVYKGLYDNIVSWPLDKQVTLRIINQHNRNLDVQETFRTKVESEAFKKPKSVKNIPSGVPCMMPLSKLSERGFIVDDKLFIECKVE